MNNNNLVKFEIDKLFNSVNVKLPLNREVNIFVGENGVGKTTILNSLYYIISGKVEKLKDISFESMRLFFDDGKKIELKYNDLQEYVNKHMSSSQISRRLLEIDKIFTENEIDEMIEILNRNDVEDSNKYLRQYIYKFSDIMGIPIRIAEREIIRYISNIKRNPNNQGNSQNVLNFKKEIQSRLKNNIMYFPTYRRIEEDLINLDVDIEQDRLNTTLINFGMKDVRKSINNLLDKIKVLSIDGFNSMTGILLKQYIDQKFENVQHIDEQVLNIALDRIGSNIDENDRKEIINLIRNGEIYKNNNRYLLNLLNNLINNYNKQSQYDEKIRQFCNVCNSYLEDKVLIYDESKVKLDVIDEYTKKNINLENLSSGEKQLVSIFCKIYLENEDNTIILFDEPELSLSIKWQEKILPDIMKSNKCEKLIAVTHSPFIFNNIYDYSAHSIKLYLDR